MRKLLIATPWITASGAASYVAAKWSQLPGRMAVTFYLGRVSGWQAKDTSVPVVLASIDCGVPKAKRAERLGAGRGAPHYAPQISPTVKPLGNGSSGSTTYCANPVIHAWPDSVGTTAA
jgi:hypothetical protein